MKVWSVLIAKSLSPRAQYARYNFSSYVAALVLVLALAAGLWAAATLIRRSGNAILLAIARRVFLLSLVIPVSGFLQTQFPQLALHDGQLPTGTAKWAMLGIALALLSSFTVERFTRSLVKGASVLLLILSPFVLVTFGQSLWLMTKFGDRPPAPALPAKGDSAPRILWLVFDEMDQRLAFAQRPPSLKLPELDRLRGQAFFATNAHSPSAQTLLSMPALFTGKLISRAAPRDPSELLITYGESAEAVGWSTQPNIFSEAHRAGFNTALMGWYHPYCRIIGGSLTSCRVYEVSDRGFSRSLANHLSALTSAIPFIPPQEFSFAQKKEPRRGRLDVYFAMLEEAKKLAVNRDYGLILVHWPLPHMPAIYDRSQGDFRWDRPVGYLDNLALVDRTVGELRRTMEEAGMWDRTTILITSDHSLRGGNWDVKFPCLSEEDAAVVGR
ncbi:MAG TPA: sulfatase-like hydrolase/transferase, partial [Blastocatellia bacterium]|nr:sulfatase-like hydrolase/transferase [Blastocatellia bacterium]